MSLQIRVSRAAFISRFMSGLISGLNFGRFFRNGALITSVSIGLVLIQALAGVTGAQAQNQGERFALSRYAAAAEAGDANAQYLLAHIYDQGLGGVQNRREAAIWYAKAAAQGDVRAQFRLAVMLHLADGVPENLSEAARLYRQAARAGVLEAQYNLGQMMELGLGMDAAPWVAKELYETAAEAGLPQAMTALGNLLARGFLGEAGEEAPDPVSAMVWLTRAVSAGDHHAEALIALIEPGLSDEARAELAKRLP